MKQWHMIFDVGKCTNCRNCFISVLDEYNGNEHKGYSKSMPRSGRIFDIKTYEQGEGQDVQIAYVPQTCNNCADAPCLKAGKNGSVYKRDDGIIMIDPEKSKGQKELVDSCPHGQIWWNEEEQVPMKWSFDAHLLDQGWKKPRMVEACPTYAIEAVKLTAEEMEAKVDAEGLQPLQPDDETGPKVLYKNLDLAFKRFLTGTVLTEDAGKLDAVEGADVKLFRDGRELQSVKTDFFGDFKFTGLEARDDTYEVRVVNPACGTEKSREITLDKSRRIANFIYTGS